MQPARPAPGPIEVEVGIDGPAALAVLGVASGLVLHLAFFPSGDKVRELLFFAFVLLSVPTIMFVAARAVPGGFRSKTAARILEILVAISGVAVLALTLPSARSVFPIERPAWFAIGAGTAAILIALQAWRRPPHPPSRRLRAVALVSSVVVLLLLFDHRLAVETLSFGPYIGPAVNVLHGGAPMRDVFSQYGLNYLLFAAVVRLSDYSLPAVAALASLAHVASLVTLLLIAGKILKNASSLLLVGIGLIGCWLLFPFNPSYNPSILGFRFLPLYTLAWALVCRPASRWPTWASVVLCSLWSLETMLFGAGLLAIHRAGRAAMAGEGAGRIVAAGARAVGALLLPHVGLTFIYAAVLGGLPDYVSYLEIVRAYGQVTAGYWLVTSPPGFSLWLLHLLGYSVALALIFLARGPLDLRLALLCVVVLGLAQLAYFLGRSTPPLLAVGSGPLVLLAAWAFEWASTRDGPRRAVPSTVIGVTGLLFASLAGAAAAKIARPLNLAPALPSGTMEPSHANLLGACLRAPATCTARLSAVTQPSAPFDPADRVGGQFYEQAREAYEQQREIEAAGLRAFAFVTDTATVNFHLRRRAPWGLSNPLNDGLSDRITGRAIALALGDLRPGDVLVVAQAPPLFPFSADARILAAVEERFRLCPVESARRRIAVRRIAPADC